MAIGAIVTISALAIVSVVAVEAMNKNYNNVSVNTGNTTLTATKNENVKDTNKI